MKDAKYTIGAVAAFIIAGVLSHFPLAVISLNIVTSRKIALPALIIGLGILIYGVVLAIVAIRKRHVWLAAAWGVLVSFAVTLSVVANQVISSVK
jgi:hypothetical protein